MGQILRYYQEFFLRYVDFRGRTRRAGFWYVVLINLIIGFVLNLLAPFSPMAVSVLSWAYSLATLIPGIALGVRRLHDIGRRGWWLLLALVPLVGSVVLIVWFCLEGTPGDNEYGPDPKYN